MSLVTVALWMVWNNNTNMYAKWKLENARKSKPKPTNQQKAKYPLKFDINVSIGKYLVGKIGQIKLKALEKHKSFFKYPRNFLPLGFGSLAAKCAIIKRYIANVIIIYGLYITTLQL